MRKNYRTLQQENELLRRKLEDQTGESPAYYLISLFNQLPWEIFVFEQSSDRKHFILTNLNDAAVHNIGMKEDLQGRYLKNIFPKHQNKTLTSGIRKAIKTGEEESLNNVTLVEGVKRNILLRKLGEGFVSMICHPVDQEGSFQEEEDPVPQQETAGELQDKKKKYKHIIMQSPTALMEIDPGGEILAMNKSARDLLSITTKKKPSLFETQSLESTVILTRFKECIQQRQLVEGEDWIRRKEKESLPVRFHFNPAENANGEVESVIGVFDDLSRLREIEDQLRQTTRHYKDLVTLLPEVIFEADSKGRISFVNDKAYEIFGYKRQELSKDFNIFNVLAKEDQERARKNFHNVLTGHQTSGNEYTSICKSGQRLPVLIYSSPITHNNEITGVRGIVVTIEEIKKAEEAIRESEKKFRQLAENINDAFWLSNLNDRILYANPACSKIAGRDIPPSSPYADIFFSWIHPEDKSRIQFEILKNQENPNEEHVYEHRIVLPDATIKWIWVRISPVFDTNGKIYRKAGIASDITRQKTLINELIKAKEKAEKADHLKSSFLANMSHEIRTPMNGILGFAELLKTTNIDEEEKIEYLGLIEKNGKQLLNLMNDIIDIAKIEAGEMRLNRKKFDLNHFLDDIYQNFSNQYPDKLKSIDFNLIKDSTQAIHLFSDQGRLNQILSNLLDNAFRYTQKGTIEFGYRLNYTVNRVKYIKFFVTDTGKGISKQDQELIFQRFGQVRELDEYKPEGTGLGLSISKNLVHLLEGRIWFESTKNKGSSFYFIIPDIREEKAEEEAITQARGEKSEDEIKTVLIVEDDLINQKYLERILSTKNIHLLDAKTGEKAIELVRQHPGIDLILMDIRLPGMNGYETTKAIKVIKPDMPVIAQTAYAMEDDYSKSLAMGCDDYISKPIDKNVLFEKLNNYLYINKNP